MYLPLTGQRRSFAMVLNLRTEVYSFSRMVPNEDRYAERAGIDYLGTARNYLYFFS